MEAPTVGVEEGHYVDLQDLCIESIGVLKVAIPSLVHLGKEELDCAALDRFVAGKLSKRARWRWSASPQTWMTVDALLAIFYCKAVGGPGERMYCGHGRWHTSQGPRGSP